MAEQSLGAVESGGVSAFGYLVWVLLLVRSALGADAVGERGWQR